MTLSAFAAGATDDQLAGDPFRLWGQGSATVFAGRIHGRAATKSGVSQGIAFGINGDLQSANRVIARNSNVSIEQKPKGMGHVLWNHARALLTPDFVLCCSPSSSARLLRRKREQSSPRVHIKSRQVTERSTIILSSPSMEKASLTISLPRAMKAFIKAKMLEGRFGTPSEYIRSLIRSDQETSEQRELEAFVRRGVRVKELPVLSLKDWASVEALILKCGRTRTQRSAPNERRGTS